MITTVTLRFVGGAEFLRFAYPIDVQPYTPNTVVNAYANVMDIACARMPRLGHMMERSMFLLLGPDIQLAKCCENAIVNLTTGSRLTA